MNDRGSPRSEFLCSLFDFHFLRGDKFLDVCAKSGFDGDTYNHITDIDNYEWFDSINWTFSTRNLHRLFSPCRGSNPSQIDLPRMISVPFIVALIL